MPKYSVTPICLRGPVAASGGLALALVAAALEDAAVLDAELDGVGAFEVLVTVTARVLFVVPPLHAIVTGDVGTNAAVKPVTGCSARA
jgi:hypothetical protein